MHCQYKNICNEMNCSAKVFTQSTNSMRCSIGNPDFIILLTNLCSHSMSQAARSEARRRNIPLLQSHGSSCAAIRRLLEDVHTYGIDSPQLAEVS